MEMNMLRVRKILNDDICEHGGQEQGVLCNDAWYHVIVIELSVD